MFTRGNSRLFQNYYTSESRSSFSSFHSGRSIRTPFRPRPCSLLGRTVSTLSSGLLYLTFKTGRLTPHDDQQDDFFSVKISKRKKSVNEIIVLDGINGEKL